ncbi:IS3 family transposase [Leptospira alstonii]|uniref:IS1236 transposase n=3 Tax=Leptospira alstonii TaxID=28452 RepID=T0FRR1_9LEPT|nr:IS3 family transposase [Leptospira alstonii]EMJ94068.1 putative IS1236 transposase [Leptospira alstonii serovar Sichuan str. 79601]EQA80390.1 putative IS1236 transposase [Leptospira alstonii serovar Pingchang str. 80-412]
MKYTYIKRNHSPVKKICKILNVSKSGYYEWLKREDSERAKSNKKLDERIRILFEEHENRSGYLRIHQDLRSEGLVVSKNRVYRRMRIMGLKADRKPSFRPVTTDSKHKFPVAPNLLGQVFKSDGLNQIWLSDITYIPIAGKWAYLFAIKDLFNREIIGWELGSTLETEHLLKAFERALSRRGYSKGVIFHSDRGVQYASDNFRKVLNTNEFIQSMSRKDNCYDNAPMESFFKTLKVEEVYRRKFNTMKEAQYFLFDYIERYYNRKRRHSALGYLTPVEFRERITA